MLMNVVDSGKEIVSGVIRIPQRERPRKSLFLTRLREDVISRGGGYIFKQKADAYPSSFG